jgi:YVTN family beta-propeller protein
MATIPVHLLPYSIAIDPTGERGYVANSGSNNVSVLDLRSHREIAAIGTGETPATVRITPDGKALVVTNRAGNSVSIIDVHTGKVRSIFPGCMGANDASILPNSSKVFVACSASHFVMAIALANAEHGDQLLTMLLVGQTPVHLALKPDGGEIFVSNFNSNTISEISTWTNDVGGAYLIGAHPSRGIVSKDNSLLYVGNFNGGSIDIYSIEDGKRVGFVHAGDGPDALAFSAAGHLLFAVNAGSGDVSVIRTQTRSQMPSLFTMLPAGPQPNAIAIKAFRVQ